MANGHRVVAGELVGYSGNTANNPHLHFSVSTCDPCEFGTSACDTLPVNFRNTSSNPIGLQRGVSYLAGPAVP